MPTHGSKTLRSNSEPTEKFLLCLTKELKGRIKRESRKMFGKRKGADSMFVEMVLRNHFGMQVEGVEET